MDALRTLIAAEGKYLVFLSGFIVEGSKLKAIGLFCDKLDYLIIVVYEMLPVLKALRDEHVHYVRTCKILTYYFPFDKEHYDIFIVPLPTK
jgi:hypothetical protein